MVVLGIISGSSLDGLDIALCSFKGETPGQLDWQMEVGATVSFDVSLSERLGKATSLGAKELLQLEVDFSKFCASSINDFIERDNLKVDYICSHGHTVFHFPEDGYTLQIGKGSIIAELTGVPCIVDVRANDIAQGGQGAPVAPIVEQYLYPGYDYYFNLGGIANVSYHKEGVITSIDSCPCNQVLNHIVAQLGKAYDDKGELARNGAVSKELLAEWKKLYYFAQPFPKSMDNSWVQEVFIPIMKPHSLSHEDRLATMVEFAALQLAADCSALSGSEGGSYKGLITGGGGFNDFLVERMQAHVLAQGLALELPDNKTINFKEAILMALMGYLRIMGKDNTIPTVTGAQKPTIGGAIYLA